MSNRKGQFIHAFVLVMVSSSTGAINTLYRIDCSCEIVLRSSNDLRYNQVFPH